MYYLFCHLSRSLMYVNDAHATTSWLDQAIYSKDIHTLISHVFISDKTTYIYIFFSIFSTDLYVLAVTNVLIRELLTGQQLIVVLLLIIKCLLNLISDLLFLQLYNAEIFNVILKYIKMKLIYFITIYAIIYLRLVVKTSHWSCTSYVITGFNDYVKKCHIQTGNLYYLACGLHTTWQLYVG